jgi:hypothetical protein
MGAGILPRRLDQPLYIQHQFGGSEVTGGKNRGGTGISATTFPKLGTATCRWLLRKPNIHDSALADDAAEGTSTRISSDSADSVRSLTGSENRWWTAIRIEPTGVARGGIQSPLATRSTTDFPDVRLSGKDTLFGRCCSIRGLSAGSRCCPWAQTGAKIKREASAWGTRESSRTM